MDSIAAPPVAAPEEDEVSLVFLDFFSFFSFFSFFTFLLASFGCEVACARVEGNYTI